MDNLSAWIESYGGPFICIPAELLHEWNGLSDPDADPLDPSHDYGRACALSGFADTIPLGAARALVFGESETAALWCDKNNHLVFVEWLYANDESEIVAALREMPANMEPDAVIGFDTRFEKHVVFDSVMPGRDCDHHGAIRFALRPGHYVIASRCYRPNDQIGLTVHRILED